MRHVVFREINMILIFGGAYQGKLDYAKKIAAAGEDIRIHDCSASGELDFTAEIIYNIENFVKECAEADIEAADFFRRNKDKWQDSILIITDISQGIVPIDSLQRKYREMNGRLMLYLAEEAQEVHRVFCGLGKQVK